MVNLLLSYTNEVTEYVQFMECILDILLQHYVYFSLYHQWCWLPWQYYLPWLDGAILALHLLNMFLASKRSSAIWSGKFVIRVQRPWPNLSWTIKVGYSHTAIDIDLAFSCKCCTNCNNEPLKFATNFSVHYSIFCGASDEWLSHQTINRSS